jgi:O-antigen/teichoic acid export membrane protein
VLSHLAFSTAFREHYADADQQLFAHAVLHLSERETGARGVRIGEFAKGAVSLASGTTIAQAIALAFTFALARLYDESAFGHFTVFMSCLAVLGVLSTGSYDKAVMFAHSPRRLSALITLVWTIAAAVALLVLLSGLVSIAMGWASPFGLTRIDHAVILPLACLLFAGSQLSVYACLKSGRLTRLAGFKVTQSAIAGGSQCTMAGVSQGAGLALGQTAGLLAMALPAMIILRKTVVDVSGGAWMRVLASARRFSRYPKYIAPSDLLDALSNQAPLIAIGSIFSLEVLGAYGFAQRILAAPSALVGQAVGQMFLQHIGRRDMNHSAIRRLMTRVWFAMGGLGVVPFGVLFLFGGPLFEFVFGAHWRGAGEIAAASAPLLFVRFISSPTSTIYYRLELQSWQLAVVVVALIVRTAPVFTHFLGASIFEVIYLQTAGEVMLVGIYNVVAWQRLGRPGR